MNKTIDSNHSISVYLPDNFDFNNLYKGEKCLPKHQQRFNDLYAFFIGNLVVKSFAKEIKLNHPHNIGTDGLRDVFGCHYKKNIQSLIDNDFIEISNSYRAGHYAKTIQLKIDSKTKIKKYEITDPFAVNKLKRLRIKITQELLSNNPAAKNVYETIKKTQINYDDCIKFLHQKYDLRMFAEWRMVIKKLKQFNDPSNLQLAFYELMMLNKKEAGKSLNQRRIEFADKWNIRINDKDKNNIRIGWVIEMQKSYSEFLKYKVRIDYAKKWKLIQEGRHDLIMIKSVGRSKRLRSDYSETPKDVRQFLKMNNKQIFDIDASNSQWLIFSSVLKKSFMQHNNSHIFFLDDFFKKTKKLNILHIDKDNDIDRNRDIDKDTNIMLHKWNFVSDDAYNENELRTYRSLALEISKLDALLDNGTFRKFFIIEFKKVGIEFDEAMIKDKMIKNVLFCNPNKAYIKDDKFALMFKNHFPMINWALNKLKLELVNYEKLGYSFKNRHKAFSIILQTIERKIFVDGLYSCNLDFATIHDAILTTEDNIKSVMKYLDDASKKQGVQLKLKIKRITNEV